MKVPNTPAQEFFVLNGQVLEIGDKLHRSVGDETHEYEIVDFREFVGMKTENPCYTAILLMGPGGRIELTQEDLDGEVDWELSQ